MRLVKEVAKSDPHGSQGSTGDDVSADWQTLGEKTHIGSSRGHGARSSTSVRNHAAACEARLAQIFDLFTEDSWRISNDVGEVKTHVLRLGRRNRLSQARVGGGGRTQLSRRVGVHTRRSIRVIASRRCLHQTSLRSPADHDDACELPPREGGGSPNQCSGHSPARTNANTGTPARTPPLRLPRQTTTAELRAVEPVSRSSIAIDCWLACKSHPI